MQNTFSIKNVIKQGWRTCKQNIQFFILISLIYLAISASPNILQAGADIFPRLAEDPLFVTLITIVHIVVFILGLIMPIGYTYILLMFAQNKSTDMNDLFRTHGVFWKFIGTGIITTGIAIVAATLGIGVLVALYMVVLAELSFLSAMIVFGIVGIIGAFLVWILMLRFMFASYVVVDMHVGPVRAIKQSWNLTKGTYMKLFLFGLAILALNLVGFLALIIGLLITIPVSGLASVYLYQTLKTQATEKVIV